MAPSTEPTTAACGHPIWNERPGGLNDCHVCGEPLGVTKRERGPSADLVIYDEAVDFGE